MVAMPPIPDGCQTILLWRNVSGNNHNPIYEIVGYTIVDDVDFQRLNMHRWFMRENSRGDCYAYRTERQNGKVVSIQMAREILNLPRGAGNGGDKADHIDHNTLNNRRKNLRKATPSQSAANTRGYSYSQRFKSVRQNRSKHEAHISFNRLQIWFTTVPEEVEAALMYNYAADLVFCEFAELNVIPEDEMLALERQWELYDMVIAKLREKKIPFDESRVMQR